MIIIDDDGVMHKVLPIDTLDKIRAEIYKLHPIQRGDKDYGKGVYDGKCHVIDKALSIIDKHIREG